MALLAELGIGRIANRARRGHGLHQSVEEVSRESLW